MKGGIDLGAFIHQVKKELVDAQAPEEGFMELTGVELEVHFGLDVSGKAGMKLWVVDIEGKAEATQLHKVKLQFRPLPTPDPGGLGTEEPHGLEASAGGAPTPGDPRDLVQRLLEVDLPGNQRKSRNPTFHDQKKK